MNNKLKNALFFSDACKLSGPTAFSTLVKPVGSRCNLDCSYCYYLDKAKFYGKGPSVMDPELLETYIRQYIQANDVPQITFCWHGGEPLLAGTDYYRRAIMLQNKYKGDREIINTMQTNGTLVTQEWCAFWKENNFLIGISIDGPQDIHDAYRIGKGGDPTWEKVMRAVDLCARTGVEYNTLSVVNNLSEGRGGEIYRFLKSIGSRYMQFLPAVEHVTGTGKRPAIVPPGTPGSQPAPWNISAKGYGRLLNDIFDEWVVQDVGRYFVQLFDVALAQWAGVTPSLCAFTETCGDAMIVEHNGDVYTCDHFVYPEFRLGNIMQDDLRELIRSDRQFRFGVNKRNTLPSECLRCELYFACRGECPKHRFGTSESGEENMNVLCEGYKLFFTHVEPYMNFMALMLQQDMPPMLVMNWARQRMGLA